MHKDIAMQHHARTKLQKGIKQAVELVSATMGACGRNIILDKSYSYASTKDGVSVLKEIFLQDKFENAGVQILKEVAMKTCQEAGDGTTTSTVLAGDLISKGLSLAENSKNVTQIKLGMEQACKEIVSKLKRHSKKITNIKQLENIATISANGDKEIGKIISQVINEVGKDAFLEVEQSKSCNTDYVIRKGMKLSMGYLSPYFITNNIDMSVEYEEPLIAVVKGEIDSIHKVLPIIKQSTDLKRPLIIITDAINQETLNVILTNFMKGNIKVCVLIAPSFGELKIQLVDDLKTYVDCDTYDLNSTNQENYKFGSCAKIKILKTSTLFIEGKGSDENINQRIEEIKKISAENNFEKEMIDNRIANLYGKVGVIRVGGYTQLEVEEKKDRIDDAVGATMSAIEEGYCSGGGITLAKCAKNYKAIPYKTLEFNTGRLLVYECCLSPFFQILKNAGIEQKKSNEILFDLMQKNNSYVYNVITNKIEYYNTNGIIDPVKVERIALEHAVSIACLLITTEGVITYGEGQGWKKIKTWNFTK